MQLMRRPSTSFRTSMWDPMRELDELSSRFQRLFGTSPGDGERETLATTDWAPACDISETKDSYRVIAELPNVKKEDIHVKLEDGLLTIHGERREEKQETGARFHRRELSYGSFMRRFTMPGDADESKIDASFRDGMLEVKIGKAKGSQAKAREIAVS